MTKHEDGAALNGVALSDGLGCDGRCPACGSFLDVAMHLDSYLYIPKNLEEHQADRIDRPSVTLRNGKPVPACPICYLDKQPNSK